MDKNSENKNVVEQVVENVMPVKDKVISVSKNKDGQFQCPNCGSSEIQPNPKTGKLRCDYCACEFDGKALLGVEKDVSKLVGRTTGLGTSDIQADSSDVVTLKCGGCGAEVVIDTSESNSARCHWCRSILSINNKLDNGSVPDAILPFKLQKEEARKKINDFVGSRKFFAHPKFKKEFTTENIMGVYFPYMLVDANCHANFKGQGEHLVRKYYVGSGDDREARYDADLYNVGREFDITIDDLSVESNSKRADKSDDTQTNNIINSIMPFDTENCIQYQGNYLVGYTSEKRDVNIDNMEEKVNAQLKDIARFAAGEDAKFYDRGIRWDYQDLNIKGTQWISAYLPVWLYSYMEVKGNKKLLHYVAVNARTGETMGSVPINQGLLFLISLIIEILSVILAFVLMGSSSGDDDSSAGLLLLFLTGFIFYGIMYLRYRNSDARHSYENETKKDVTNMVRFDEFVEKRKKLRNSSMTDRNDKSLDGDNIKAKSFIESKISEIAKK